MDDDDGDDRNINNAVNVISGIDFDLENKHSCNRLLKAVINGDEKTVKELLKNNWSPNTSDNVGRTAMHLAARSSSLYNIMKILLDSGGFPDHVTHSGVTALCLASYAGLEKTVALLIERGADINIKNYVDANALHFACNSLHPNIQVIRLLLDSGLNINSLDCNKTTPLMLAVQNKSHNAVRYLVDKGADVMLQDSDEKTAFHIASTTDDIDSFNILTKNIPVGIAIGNICDCEDWTLLMFAAQSGALNIVNRLLELKSDTSMSNNNGLIALHLAAHNSPQCFKSLLNGTPLNVINTQCVYVDEPISNSIPCLLIDVLYLDCLKLLFSKEGINNSVLTCPLVKNNRVFPPVPFTFFSDNSPEFIGSVVQLYIDRNLPLDPFPDYYPPSQVITCLESLITSHVNHALLEEERRDICSCVELFVKLLKNGASADPYSVPEDLSSNYVLWYFSFNNLLFGLSYLLRYSNYLEPYRVLRLFSVNIIENDLHIAPFSKTIKFLCKYSTPWEVSECKKLASIHFNSDQVACYNWTDIPFPSLKFLCRAAIRDHLHTGLNQYFSDYNHKTSLTFRQNLLQLNLPEFLISYLQYDDIICDIRSQPESFSFDSIIGQ